MGNASGKPDFCNVFCSLYELHFFLVICIHSTRTFTDAHAVSWTKMTKDSFDYDWPFLKGVGGGGQL